MATLTVTGRRLRLLFPVLLIGVETFVLPTFPAASAPETNAAGVQSPNGELAFSAVPTVARWRPYIAEASYRFGVPEAWIAAAMQAESFGLTHLNGRPITSRTGAMGLMQLMPNTWNDLRRQQHLGYDPYDPHDNILAGAAYLKAMYDRYGYPGLFAAYNTGPQRYEQHMHGGKPLPAETRAYIAKLAQTPASRDLPPAILSGTRLFISVGNGEIHPATGTVQPEFTPLSAPETASASVSPPADLPLFGGLFVPLTSTPGDRK